MPPKRNQNRRKPHSKSATNTKENAVENTIGNCVLPQDLMVAILARLPVKSLVRFKSVCKPWFNLFSNPKFIKIHHDLFSQAPKTFAMQSHLLKCPSLGIEPGKKIPAGVLAANPVEIFLDTCRGLVCLGRPLFNREIILWNPATNLWKSLPLSKIDFGAAEMVSLGFGCNAEGDDYKVVRIFCLKGKKMKVGVEVYSSKSDSWKTIGVGFKFKVFYSKNHVIVNGNPHWIANIDEKSKIVEGKDSQVLLGFDSTRMSFKILPLPRVEALGIEPVLPFVDWKGCVGGLVCVKRDGDWLEWIDVWVYDEGAKKWMRKERFGGIEVQVDRCLDCSKSGKIVGGCTDGKKVFVFDPSNKSVVGVGEVSKANRVCFQMLAYNESLGYVKGMESMLLMKLHQKNEFTNIDGFFVSCRTIACYYPLAF
ncbi:hypothetical protein C2S51_035454 [Perilla frutescens var. frutescens]|nr:hypothetical protein C2S51_035454 [Perilla frutescens var. frutescens]